MGYDTRSPPVGCLLMMSHCRGYYVIARLVDKYDSRRKNTKAMVFAGYEEIFIDCGRNVFRLNVRREQGLHHADENGGTGTRRQRSQDFLQRVTHTKNRKLSGFGPLFS